MNNRIKQNLVFGITLLAVFAFAWWGFKVWVPVVLRTLKDINTFPPALLFGYAFFAGALTFAAPCAIGILPAYLTFYLGQSKKAEDKIERIKTGLGFGARAGAGVALVYIAVLAILYSLPNLVAGSATGFTTTANYLVISAWTKPFIIGLLILFGLALLSDFSFSTNRAFLLVKKNLGIKADPKNSVFGFGLVYGVGSLGCGMLVIVPLVVLNLVQGKVGQSLASFFFYLLGFATLMVAMTTLVSLTQTQYLEKLVKYSSWVKRGAGFVILLATVWLVNFYLKTGGM